MKSVGFVVFVPALIALQTVAATAQLSVPDLGITNDASYQAAVQAIRTSEYVRADYALDPEPRIPAALAGLAAYAARNPLADEGQLHTFLHLYDQALRAADGEPGEERLERTSDLMIAMRFSVPFDHMAHAVLAGTDSHVGNDALGLLGLGLPEVESYEEFEEQTRAFTRYRRRDFANDSEWSTILVMGLLGRDLRGGARPALASVVTDYLRDELFSLEGGTKQRFQDVDAAIAALPASYAEYAAALASTSAVLESATNDDDAEAALLWSEVLAGFQDARVEADTVLLQIIDLPDVPLRTAIDRGDVPSARLDAQNAYNRTIDNLAGTRARISANTFLLFQSDSEEVRQIAARAREVGDGQMEATSRFASLGAGFEVASSLFNVGKAFVGKNPFEIAGALGDSVITTLEAGGTLEPIRSADEQIFDEIVATRQQIAALTDLVDVRFDRVESQLEGVYFAMTAGFDGLVNDIADLQVDVNTLRRDIEDQAAALDRIEDWLRTLGQDVVTSQFAVSTNLVLNFRDQNGIDLDYATGFITGLNEFATYGETTAALPTFAGPGPQTITIDNAAALLNGSPVSQSLNDLADFASSFSPAAAAQLPSGAIPAPYHWSQAATFYSQAVRENPWYFAFQQSAPEGQDLINPLIDSGDRITDLTAALDDPEAVLLPLVDDYLDTVDAMQERVEAIRDSVLDDLKFRDQGVLVLDPWGGFGQDLTDVTETGFFPQSGGQTVLRPRFEQDPLSIFSRVFTMPFAPGDPRNWDLFLGSVCGTRGDACQIPMLVYLLERAENTTASYRIGYYADMESLANCTFGPGSDPQFVDGESVAVFQVVFQIDAEIDGIPQTFGFVREIRARVRELVNVGPPPSYVPTWQPFCDFSDGTYDFEQAASDVADNIFDAPGFFKLAEVDDFRLDPAFQGVSFVEDLSSGNALNGTRRFYLNNRLSVNSFTTLDFQYISDRVLSVSDFMPDGTPVTGDALEELVTRFHEARDQVWADVIADNTPNDANSVTSLAELAINLEALLDAFSTLVVPDTLETSTIARSALRGNPLTSDMALEMPGTFDLFAPLIGENINSPFYDLSADYGERAALLGNELLAALEESPQTIGYHAWSLAELRETRDLAFRLALDDTYTAVPGMALDIPASSGVLANDVKQTFSTVHVDTGDTPDGSAFAVIPPVNGVLTMDPDGAFRYTPNPGFQGEDVFSYTAFVDYTGRIDTGPGGSPPIARSDYATVIIRVGVPQDQPGAWAPAYDSADMFDLIAFLRVYDAGNAAADIASPSGTLDAQDVSAFVEAIDDASE